MTPLHNKVDVPIVLNDVDVNEDYEGAFDSRRISFLLCLLL